jgi:hypothetical protein
MADLRIGAEVDVSQLGKLAEGSERVAASTRTAGSSFAYASEEAANLATKLMAQGVSAKEAEGALINMGMSARNAAAIMAQLTGATAALGTEVVATTTKVDAFTRQMANSAVRIAASEAGLGQLGFAFGRLGAMSSALAPILASTFAVFAAVAFVEIVNRAIDAYEKWTRLGEETVHKIDDQTLSLAHESDQLDVVNIRLQNQIDKLEHKPENHLALALAEVKVQADALSKSLEDALIKSIELLKAGPGLASEIFLGKANMKAVGDLLEPLKREMEFAQMRNDAEGQRNILLKEQAILQNALVEEQAKHLTKIPAGPRGMGERTIGSLPDQDALNAYRSLLAGIQDQLSKITKTGTEGELEIKKAQVQTAEDRLKAAEKFFKTMADWEDEEAKRSKSNLDAELEMVEKLQSVGLPLSLLATTTDRKTLELLVSDERKAQEELARVQKKNEEDEKRAAKEVEEAWQRAAEERIRNEEEAYRVSQHAAENRMRDIKAQESFTTAGIGKGPITTVLEGTSLAEQGAVASAAMKQARDAAADYQSQLDIVNSVMAETNRESEEGRKTFNDLSKQADQLRHALDGAVAAGEHWNSTVKQIDAQQKALQLGFTWENLKTSMESAANAGFNSFNSAFVKMLNTGTSFIKVMQQLWLGMVDTFVTSILKMAEQWVVQHVIMMAISKIFGATSSEASATDITAKELGRQAAIGDAAATAAIEAAWLGPAAAIAAAGAVEGALQGITTFEGGGIVKAGLHEGEMVLPAHLSTFVQTAAAEAGRAGPPGPQGASGGRGGDMHFHLPTHIGELKAWDGASVRSALMEHGDLVGSIAIAAVKRHFRSNGVD